jgi:predicted outer membrane protein
MRAAIAGELTEAQIAQSSATNAAVVAFAKQMVAEYSQYNLDLTTYETSAVVMEQSCAQSVQIDGVAGQALASIQAASPSAFDATYIGAEVVSLQNILDMINGQIFGCVNDATLKALIRGERKTVLDGGQTAGIANDLHTAQALQSALGDAGTTDGGTNDATTNDAGDAGNPSDAAADGG